MLVRERLPVGQPADQSHSSSVSMVIVKRVDIGRLMPGKSTNGRRATLLRNQKNLQSSWDALLIARRLGAIAQSGLRVPWPWARASRSIISRVVRVEANGSLLAPSHASRLMICWTVALRD